MSIAIITGASSGIGLEFFKSLINRNEKLDEIWVIARGKEKLQELKKLTNIPVKVLAYDLSHDDAYEDFEKVLNAERPHIKYLFCGSGFGRFNSVLDDELKVLNNMVDLNCKGVLGISKLAIPYMEKGSSMILISSISALQPIPYIATYAATKSFVLSYGRALNQELKKLNTRVLTVCPFWTKTKFFDRAKSENSIVKKYVVMYEPEDIIKRIWHDLKYKNRDVSICGPYTRAQALLVKLLPHKLVMHVWMRQQKLK